jgi:hypothetical protein
VCGLAGGNGSLIDHFSSHCSRSLNQLGLL